MVAKCPADNTAAVEQEDFWNGDFDAHKIGWIISGAAAGLTILISFITIFGHARNYNRPLEQRQIIRILLFAPVFATISFLSYRFFRSYTYYELAEVTYEAFAIAAFLMLLLQYVGDNVEEQIDVFAKKEKRKLPMPFCCWRYRPSKAYFLNLLKWGVIQYVIIRPALSIAGIILEYYELLCTSSYSYKYGEVYLVAVDFVSISIALYALIVLYGLLKEDLKGRRPLAKFMTIKLAIFFTFYQSFVFGVLQDHGVIKGTEYWSSTNVTDGLSALCTSLEMVVVAAFQMWAFPWNEYYVTRLKETNQKIMPIKANKKGKTSILRSLINAMNFSDFFVELWHSIRFGIDRIRGKEYTRTDARFGKFDIAAAFGAEGQGNASMRGDQSPLARSESRFEMEEHSLDKDGEKLKSIRKDKVAAVFDPNSSSGFSSGPGNDTSYLHPNSPRSDFTSRASFNDSDTLASLNSNPVALGSNGAPSRRRPSFDPHPLSQNAIQEDEDYNFRPDASSLIKNNNQSLPRSSSHNTQNGLSPVSPLDLINMPGQADLGRLSPSPRSPRDSSGRYPSFIYDSNKLKDSTGTDSFTRSRSVSPNPGKQGAEREIIRQPSPLQPGSWNQTPYRVSGFPRDSFIETDPSYVDQQQSRQSQDGPLRVHPGALYPAQFQPPKQRQIQPQQPQQDQQRRFEGQSSDLSIQPLPLPQFQAQQPQSQQRQQHFENQLQPSISPQPRPNLPLPTTPPSVPNQSIDSMKSNQNPNPDLNPASSDPSRSLLEDRQAQASSSTEQPMLPIHIPPPSSRSPVRSSQFINQTGFRDSLFVPETSNGNQGRPNSLVGENGELEASSNGHGSTKSRPGSWEPQAL